MKNEFPLAHVHPGAKIGQHVHIRPYTYIEEDVVIGDGCEIGPHVSIYNGARIGKNVRIFPGAVIAAIPQDLKYKGEYSTAEIGDNTTVRECVTVNRGTAYAERTVVGANCLLMAYVHVAHDCILGDHVILANNVNLAGHVEIENWAIIEGQVGVQQFIKIGEHSFVAGGSLVRKNVPPYVKAAREPLSYAGVNYIGLQRRHFSSEQIQHIQDIYRILYVKGYNTSRAIELIEDQTPPSPERENILRFIRDADLGIMRGYRHINGSNVNEG